MATTAAETVKQAGGGISKKTDPASFHIEHFQSAVMDGLVTAYKDSAQDFPSMKEFMEFMASDKANAMGSFPYQDLHHSLSNYFISSSHNTYLTGNQLYGKATVDGYKNVLLRGCRCVEIDVWDGESSSGSSSEEEKQPSAPKGTSFKPTPWKSNSKLVEPIVLHGHTATKDISFRSVCETIRDNSFVTSSLPVIVSLEVHTCHDQQKMMVEIMEECFKGMLIDVDSASDAALPSPEDLQGKILIKVKYSPPETSSLESATPLTKVVTSTSVESDQSGLDAKEQPKAKPSKIIEALSRLGIYTKGYSFKSLDRPEATVPTHVFSLSEHAIMEVHKSSPEALFNHNKHYLMRAFPKGIRINSSNLDPAASWRKGVQMVALNWQKFDEGVMLNEGMFAGSGGWVLKPPMYQSTSTKYPNEGAYHGSTFSVEIFAGQDIEPPHDVGTADFKPYVKCELHVEVPGNWEELAPGKEKDGEFKAKTKTSKTSNPNFKRQILKFEKLPSIIPELGFVRFKVMHDKLVNDPLAAWACIRLDRLQRGYRFIHLFNDKGVQTKGVILARFDFDWKLLVADTSTTSDASIKLPLR